MVNVVTEAAYHWIYWFKLTGLVQSSAATWRSYYIQSNEPGELSQWLCHDDSTMNTGTGIITIYLKFFYTPGSKGSRGLKTKVKNKNQVAGVALVQFGRSCKSSFESYRVVVLDRQRDSLK